MRSEAFSIGELTPAARAFNKQAAYFDIEDQSNQTLIEWRNRIYKHIDSYLKPNSQILELNAGTGIDAVRFVHKGHRVHAIDIAPGMIDEINEKIKKYDLRDLTCAQLSYDSLSTLSDSNFDYVFSNFGGLNCCEDLSRITSQLPRLIHEGSLITFVIMPPICPWELLWLFRGRKTAFRRLKKRGAIAHIDGEYFKTFYYSLSKIKHALGSDFKLKKAQGLGAVSPPPSSYSFVSSFPGVAKFLNNVDQRITNYFPFNRWADHIIVTFQYLGK